MFGKKFFSQKTAIYSCLFFAFYPDLLYSVYVVQQLTIVTFLIPTLTYFTYEIQQKPTYKKAIITGILYGFFLLVEPVIVFMLALFLIWMAIFWIHKIYKKEKSLSMKSIVLLKKNALSILLLIIMCSVIITPWLIRCFIVYDGRFVFIKANGFNLWRGNNPQYTNKGRPSHFLEDTEGLTKEGEIDQWYFENAIEYMITNIPETIFNCFRKFLQFWGFQTGFGVQTSLLRAILYIPLLVLFVLALIFERKRKFNLIPLLIPLLCFTLVYSITFVLPRYRVPIQPIMFIFSAYAFNKCVNMIMDKLRLKKRT